MYVFIYKLTNYDFNAVISSAMFLRRRPGFSFRLAARERQTFVLFSQHRHPKRQEHPRFRLVPTGAIFSLQTNSKHQCVAG